MQMYTMNSLKEDVTEILGKFFSGNIIHGINKYYDDDHPEELIELATNMLSGMVGETMAQKYLEQILNKYHLNP